MKERWFIDFVSDYVLEQHEEDIEAIMPLYSKIRKIVDNDRLSSLILSKVINKRVNKEAEII